MKKTIVFLITSLSFTNLFAQTAPDYGREIPVNINGLTFDAMEVFLSPDGNYLFFNSLNDNITTSLYYATKINDSTFTYSGPLTGANQTITPRLDAVAAMDSANHFYWISTRNYANDYQNIFHGYFNGSNVVNIGRIHGDFYTVIAGWIMIEGNINYDGTLLYYNVGYFNNCNIPCKAMIGIAKKVNDSTFNKLKDSDLLLKNVNDTAYDVYAPNISKDGLELYYTRILKSNPTSTDICVSVRKNATDAFSVPEILFNTPGPDIAEAPTLSADKTRMYYHKKTNGVFKVFLRYRTSPIDTIKQTVFDVSETFQFYPNPAQRYLNISYNEIKIEEMHLTIYSSNGKLVFEDEIQNSNMATIDISTLVPGIYLVRIFINGQIIKVRKLVISKQE
jgi:hypothetical protein